MPFGFSDTWIPVPIDKLSDWQNSAELKRQFAVELAKTPNDSFEAACIVFGKDTNKALWASINWVNDQQVIEDKTSITKENQENPKLLDKDQLAAKLLSFADEKITFNGNLVYAAEAKDRLKALEIYAKIQGYDKSDSQNNTFINNHMVVKFIEPKENKQETKVIEHKEEVVNSPIKLKLVS